MSVVAQNYFILIRVCLKSSISQFFGSEDVAVLPFSFTSVCPSNLSVKVSRVT